jgi:hypothetical protein
MSRSPDVHEESQKDSLVSNDGRISYLVAPLSALLWHFRGMGCQIPRDRVYSLLSVCAEKRASEIDHSSSSADACINFLLSMGDLSCMCAPGLIANSMRVRGGLSAMTTRGTKRQPFLKIEVRVRVTTLWKACSNQGFHTSFEFGTPEACCPDRRAECGVKGSSGVVAPSSTKIRARSAYTRHKLMVFRHILIVS